MFLIPIVGDDVMAPVGSRGKMRRYRIFKSWARYNIGGSMFYTSC